MSEVTAMQAPGAAPQAIHPTPAVGMRRLLISGALVIGVFFGGLGGWAAVAPLSSAAIAPGEVVVESQRKSIQHLEGGIVEAIEVTEGQQVMAGQRLLRLERTRSAAALEQLRVRRFATLALEARLIAERDGVTSISFPEALVAAAARSEVRQAVDGERSIFAARREALAGQRAIIGQRIAQLEKEIGGLEQQIAAEGRQLEAIAQERRGHQQLVKRKLAGMQRLLELKRDEAEVAGDRARHVAEVARARQQIGEEKLKILELDTQRSNEVVAQLRDVQTQLFDLAERLRTARDVLSRTEIRAPLDGTVVGLQVHTVGGVVSPGATLMDVVPAHERLIVQARVKPEDIEAIHPGLVARVALTAFSRRNVAPIEGRVQSISADRLTDQRTGAPYFLARIDIPPADDADLYPGMQAEVQIVIGEDTPLNYLIRPALESFGRALREN